MDDGKWVCALSKASRLTSVESYEKASTDLFESFRQYDESGSPQRIQVLKYLVLAYMLMGSEINPFDSQETKPSAWMMSCLVPEADKEIQERPTNHSHDLFGFGIPESRRTGCREDIESEPGDYHERSVHPLLYRRPAKIASHSIHHRHHQAIYSYGARLLGQGSFVTGK